MNSRLTARNDPDGEDGEILHGGRLIEARRAYPDAPQPFVDLSTGINPVPYPVPDLPSEAFSRLPEPEEIDALQECAAEAYGCAGADMVAAGSGTQSLIEMLPHLFPARTVNILAPTYGEHAPAWARSGTEIREVSDFGDLGGGDSAVLCNPNNPDGRAITPERIQEMARRLDAQGGVLIVDEAFAEFAEQGLSCASALPCPGLIILRSFGKAYGLAGLRLGFALASPAVAARIRDALGPWAVSGPAVHTARAALADRAWREATGNRLGQDANRLDELLIKAGFVIVGGTSLFRLGASDQAPDIFERLARAGLLIRRFDHTGDWLRFGLPGKDAEWTRLEAALGASSS